MHMVAVVHMGMHAGALYMQMPQASRWHVRAHARGRAIDYYFPFLLSRVLLLFLRRQKRDWNEVLRLKDHATMDYVR